MKALIVVDMQNDFVNGILGTPEAREIVPYIAELIREYHQNKDMVIFTQDMHEKDYLETIEGQKLPVRHCIRNTRGVELVPDVELEMRAGDCVIQKSTFGAMKLPDNLNDEIESITLVGVCTGICVLANAVICKAAFPNTPITVIADACACVTPESHQRALDAMRMQHIEIQ